MENGQVSASEVKNILSTFQNKVTEKVKNLINEMKNYANKETTVDQPTIAKYESNLYYPFVYAEGGLNIQIFYQVPKNFKCPSCNRKQG